MSQFSRKSEKLVKKFHKVLKESNKLLKQSKRPIYKYNKVATIRHKLEWKSNKKWETIIKKRQPFGKTPQKVRNYCKKETNLPKKFKICGKLVKESHKLVHKRDEKWQASVKKIQTHGKSEKKSQLSGKRNKLV